MINYFNATDAHFRLQAPTNKAAYLGIAKLLLDSGLDPNSADLLSGESVVFEAIRLNDKEMLALLLNYVSELTGALAPSALVEPVWCSANGSGEHF